MRCAPLLVVLIGCAPAATLDAGTDAGSRPDAGAIEPDAGPPLPPPPFAVRFLDWNGDVVDEGDRVGIEVGCQGGAHVFAGVEVGTDVGPEGTIALGFVVEAGPPEQLSVRRPMLGGGVSWLEPGRLVFSDYAVLIDDPTPAALIAIVRTADAAYRTELPVTAVQLPEFVCAVETCEWTEQTLPGTLLEVHGPGTVGCEIGRTTLELELRPEGSTSFMATASIFVEQECVEPLGLVTGSELDVVVRTLASGPCFPRQYRPILDMPACRAICPAP